MALSNTATPKYYGMFRDAVMRGEIPVCETISLEMNRIDALIANPRYWYDDQAVQGFINFCENELTLTTGEPLQLLPSFKLWAESVLVGTNSRNVLFLYRIMMVAVGTMLPRTLRSV